MPNLTRNFTGATVGSGKPRILVVGLGNVSHPGTRHSVGQQIVEALANHLGTTMTYDRSVNSWIAFATTTMRTRTPRNKKGKSSYIEGSEQEVELVMVKPKPLMNISGPAVSKAYKAHIRPAPLASTVIVIHDSLAHKTLQTSIKRGGSAGGHNGVRSAVDALGSPDFARIRVGIGAHRGDAATYVLENMSGTERSYWSSTEACEKILLDIETLVSDSAET
ncbi:peptidyl-tRNA hydrolase [Auriculariales sp. MPI-PUGE-AT-0066]|nr:peptidyl-tRNA hydrolase [Auriculariales sp. MPI-PUGE-AT-0066]